MNRKIKWLAAAVITLSSVPLLYAEEATEAASYRIPSVDFLWMLLAAFLVFL